MIVAWHRARWCLLSGLHLQFVRCNNSFRIDLPRHSGCLSSCHGWTFRFQQDNTRFRRGREPRRSPIMKGDDKRKTAFFSLLFYSHSICSSLSMSLYAWKTHSIFFVFFLINVVLQYVYRLVHFSSLFCSMSPLKDIKPFETFLARVWLAFQTLSIRFFFFFFFWHFLSLYPIVQSFAIDSIYETDFFFFLSILASTAIFPVREE